MSSVSDLTNKNADVAELSEKALKDEETLSEVFEGISSDKARIKYGCAKVLRFIAERNPQVLYPKWNFFASMLNNANTFLRCDGVYVIGHLAVVDSENKIDRAFDRLYNLLNDESMITAANLIGVSAIIAKAKPELEPKITNKLMSIDRTHHSAECKNVLKGHAMVALDAYFKESSEKKRILDFIRSELKNPRPGTKRKAMEFLKKWG
jgi:hypothetical protein